MGSTKKYDRSVRKSISKRYEEGEKTSKLAEEFNVCPKTIQKYVKEFDVILEQTNLEEKINGKDVSNICERYKNGESSYKIARSFNISQPSVTKVLRQNDVEIRDRHDCQKKYEVDESSFDSLDSGSKYWLGFLIADGSIVENHKSYRLELGLQPGDKDHLEKFKDFVNSSHPIEDRKHTNGHSSVRVTINSFKLCKSLISYGIVPNKEQKTKCPPNLHMSNSFWRGVLDGDGHINESDPSVNCTGTKKLMNQMLDYFKTICETEANVRPIKNNKAYTFTVSGYRKASKVLNKLYKDSDIYLDRKKSQAMTIIKEKYI